MHPIWHLIPTAICLGLALLAADFFRAEWRAGAHRCGSGRRTLAYTQAIGLAALGAAWIAALPITAWIRSAL